MIFKNINSEDISGLIICSEPPISSSAIRTKETTIDGRDGAIVEKLGYKTRIRNVEIGLKKDANVDKILSYFSGEGDLIFKNENDKVYKAAIYEQVDLERLLRLRKGSVAFYCQPFKYKRNDIFETIKDNKVKEKKGKHLELLNCAEQNVVDLKIEGSTTQSTRSGKNIFNKNAIIRTNGVTKSVLDTGVRITQTHAGQFMYGGIKLGGSELLGKTLRMSANWTKSADNVPYIAVYFGNSSSMVLYTLEGIGVSGQIKQITLPNAFPTVGEKVCDTVYILLYSNRNGTGNVGDYVDYTDLIVTIDNDDMTYEDYGASPSPDYPSPIENVEGKNKFNKSNMTEATWDNGKTNTVTLLEDGRIQSTANYAQWAAKCIDIPNLKANTDYVVSGKIISSTADNAMIIVKGYKNNTLSNIIYHRYAVGTRFELSFNSSDYEKIGISLSGDNNTLNTTYTTIFDEIQLEEGTAATDYVPYNSLEIKNVGENLFNPSNAKDGCVSDGSGQIISVNIKNKNTGYIKIDGEEKYFILSNKLTGNWGAWYDKDKKFISGITLGDKNKGIVTAPNNAYFINFTVSYENNNPDYANNVMIARSDKETPYKPYQEQKVTFPLVEGQKLMKGSYLASDGIHNKKKQVVYNGTENWAFSPNKVCTFIKGLPSISKTGICTHYKSIKTASVFGIDTGIYLETSNSAIISDPRFSTIDEFKTYLQEQYSNGTPVTVEYELAEEEIVPYTEEQQEAYNQLQKLKLYKGQNTMFSMEGSIINLKYLEDTDEKVENQGNIYSKPIIRLEKTVFKEVEIAINGIRFKYNFEEDDYVEIDCEEMTVQYEGLDRNRRLVIDFEFPKLKEGNNDIIMYSGDCIIKCKRKDRWL